ncbi:hydroxyacylglutathione hydrolase [Paraburkholderia dioscoreae]|uniref:Hydroxyacylglutathione hydrolase n=1 Tax=Paraburkholderia dioscoreae TaxID=2604047 RepID=A0A5Q4Z3K5_9BURK|nr:hydroxyacylglutathione hydrolase [Paraburkholderia dioscoreae]VVD33686.1 Hydroxyacylglutathione hydrolase [Paraburkholderia dioscoreae]
MAKSLEYIPVPFLDDNYAWVVTDGTFAIVVDPGVASPVERFCKSRNLLIKAVLLTHHHRDHVDGVRAVLRSCGQADTPVFGPDREPIACVTRRMGDGSEVEVGELNFRASVIATPGHTHGHIVFFQSGVDGQPGHLFAGDTLFASGCGRLLEGSAEEMLASLDKLAALPASTLLHCAHEYTLSNLRFAAVCEPGNEQILRWQEKAAALRLAGRPTLPTTIGHEFSVNPFLRVQQRELQGVLIQRFGLPVPHRLAAFILLRAWKDMFQGEYPDLIKR